VQEFEIDLPELFPAQEQILESAARFNVVHGGAQSGLSALAIDVLLMSHLGAVNGYHTAFLLPDEDAVVKAKRRVFSVIHPLVIGRPDRPRVDLVTGGSIRFAALNDPSLQLWDQLSLIVVDDAAQVPRLEPLWFDMLEPLLAQFRGSAWFLSKPAGTRNGFANLASLQNSDPRWASHNLRTSDNPYYDRAKLAADKARFSADEYAQERDGLFVHSEIRLSASQRIIRSGETFREWCGRLAADGLKVDGHPFELDNRRAMHFIYDLIPSTREEAYLRVDVIMKCTQVGFTVYEQLAMLYLSLRFAPAKIGMFMPSQMLATGKSSQRFMGIVRTIPQVHGLMTDAAAADGKAGEGNVLTRNLGESRFHFLWTSGKTATESNPMDVVSFDEVQEMKIADMEKTRERMSASKLRYTLMGSTANWPDEDIHWWYKKGTQHQFHTRCPACQTMQVLDEHFPQCIGFDPTAPRVNPREREAGMVGEYRYRCHACSGWIDDPQEGEWIAKVPDAAIRSVHFPQFLSPTISPREMIEAYRDSKDMKNYYNRKLGKPYVDPSQVPVNMEMLRACAEEGERLGVQWKDRGFETFAGVDQMGSFNVILIAERLQSGHLALIHAEEIYDEEPFNRCSVLLEQYGVRVCVVETLPNYNSAKAFANRHPGVVFLAGYGNMESDMLRWGDDRTNRSERRTAEEDRDQHTVTLDQYKCMQVALGRIAKKVCVFPNPKGLLQELAEDQANGRGPKQLRPILEDRVWVHFTRTALIAERDEEEKKFRRRVVKVGIDPHFSYAFMLLNVAWARAHGTSMFLFPDDREVSKVVEVSGAIATSPVLNRMLDETASIGEGKCGSCSAFDAERGFCGEREVLVRPGDTACFLYEER
jgi:hypothetical protein